VIQANSTPSSAAVVTTVIPTYRRPALLARAIDSVLRQSAGIARVAVYDNASGDETGVVVEEMARRDSRVQYHRQTENRGPFENFRSGMAGVSTPFFSLLSDDDLLLPGFYEAALEALRAHPAALFAVTRVLQVDRAGRLLNIEGLEWRPGFYEPPFGFLEMIRLGYITWTGTLFRREVIERAGGFDRQTAAAFDLDFALRLAARSPFVICERIGGVYVVETSAFGVEGRLAAWERIIDNIGREPAVPASARVQAQADLRRQLGGLVFRLGRAAARRGELAEASSAARVLRERFQDHRRARLIEVAAQVCHRLVFLPPIAGLALVVYRGARSMRLRALLDPGDRHFLRAAGIG